MHAKQTNQRERKKKGELIKNLSCSCDLGRGARQSSGCSSRWRGTQAFPRGTSAMRVTRLWWWRWLGGVVYCSEIRPNLAPTSSYSAPMLTILLP
jgi:hypothetical protein